MKTGPRIASRRGLTLVEVFVLILFVAVLAVLLSPPISRVGGKSESAKALSNARQISLALILYADEHGGKLPSFTLRDGNPTSVPVPDSNTAFAQLFPDYLKTESIFWVPKSAFCSSNPPDGVIDKPPLDTPVNTLKQGENEWAYVLQITSDSDPNVPLIASGFADPVAHTYSGDPLKKGGLWKGLKAIVIHADGSGIIAPVDQHTMQVAGPNGNGNIPDIFTTSNAANGWLTPANVVVNPK